MAEIESNLDLEVKIRVTFEITESEARALDAMVGYGFEPFLSVFYKNLGSHYMKPHEKGLKSFFASVKSQVVPQLFKIGKFKNELSKALTEVKHKATLT